MEIWNVTFKECHFLNTGKTAVNIRNNSGFKSINAGC